MNVSGKSVLVTGGSQGLGRALGESFARGGARVALVARHAGPLRDVVDSIRREGGEAHAVVADVGDKEAIHRVTGAAAALIGPIDVLVHAASTLGAVRDPRTHAANVAPMPLLLDTECEDFERVLAVNVVGPFRLTKAIAGSMAMRGGGTVLMITSDASTGAYPTWGAYGVSKAALDHLARIWGAELADANVRFLTIDPGEMDTAMHRDAFGAAHDPSRLARPQEVARTILEMVGALGRDPRLASGARVEAARWVAEALR